MANAKPRMDELFARVRETQDASLRLRDSGEHARAKARLLQAIDEVEAGKRPAVAATPTSASHGWRWGLGTLAAAACTVAIVVGWPGGDDMMLSYEVDGVDYAANQMIRADQGARTLVFSDDSTVALADGSRMKIAELRDSGATVSLLEGEVNLAVHHEHETSWQVEAGPWTVHVTGTQFTVDWKPQLEYFRVVVNEGSVRVEGPDGELAKLRAGESLVRERGKATIEPETLEIANEPEVVAALEPEGREADSDDEPEADKGEAGTHEAKPSSLEPSTPQWIEHFDAGEYDAAWQVLANQADGIHGTANNASARTLLELSDIARFTKHYADAELLLEQLRAEHPASSAASEAAFYLGRMAMKRGAQAKAAPHFERYLDEAPTGNLASDALGRLMDCYTSLGRDNDARSAAERYLAAEPKGPHATKAQSILSP